MPFVTILTIIDSLLCLSLSFLAVIAQSDDLYDLFFVQVFEATWGDHIVMVLLSEQQASLTESLTVERIRILEDLADRLDRDVLGQDLLASFLNRGHVKAVGKLQQFKTS